jgi:type VI secretion system protein ImpG
LADAAALKSWLSLYNFLQRTDQPTGRANQSRLEAVGSVELRPVTRVVRGAGVRGVGYRVVLDGTAFATEGEAFLFGSILHGLLSMQAPINSFSELELVLRPSNMVYRWKP